VGSFCFPSAIEAAKHKSLLGICLRNDSSSALNHEESFHRPKANYFLLYNFT
jgi:hypothetical protein